MDTPRLFFRSWLNRALVAVFCLLIIALALVIPLVDVKSSRDNSKDSVVAAIAAASRYAVIKTSFPDPCIISTDGTWYAFGTQATADINVQVASAQDISKWTLHEGVDALPNLPPWAKQGDAAVWAPSVVQRPDGQFVMYFAAAHHVNTSRHCIGAAVASTVTGPYQPLNDTLACHFDQGGIIDPDFFHDPLTNISTVIFKNDGNAIGTGGACSNSNWPNTATSFQYLYVNSTDYTTRIGNDSWTPSGNATWFLTNDRSDGPNIESPAMWYHKYVRENNATNVSAYHLAYNSGCYADESYRIEHIVCWPAEVSLSQYAGVNDTVGFRDCEWNHYKSWNGFNKNVLLQTGQYPQPNGDVVQLYAPGGPDVTQDGNYLVFHADTDPTWFSHRDERGLRNRTRAMFIAELEYSGEDTGVKIKQLVLPTT